MKRIALWLALAAFPLLVVSTPAPGAVDMFLKIGDIKGESKDKDHKDWIDIQSYSFGLSNSGTFAVGGGGGAGKVSFQDFNFAKFVDASSPHIFQAVATGKHFAEANFEVVDIFGSARLPFVRYKLGDVMVTSFSQSSGGDLPTESFSLNYAKIEFEYRMVDDKGKAGPWIHASWDLKTASPAPEPSTWALLLAGLGYVAWRTRYGAKSRTA